MPSAHEAAPARSASAQVPGAGVDGLGAARLKPYISVDRAGAKGDGTVTEAKLPQRDGAISRPTVPRTEIRVESSTKRPPAGETPAAQAPPSRRPDAQRVPQESGTPVRAAEQERGKEVQRQQGTQDGRVTDTRVTAPVRPAATGRDELVNQGQGPHGQYNTAEVVDKQLRNAEPIQGEPAIQQPHGVFSETQQSAHARGANDHNITIVREPESTTVAGVSPPLPPCPPEERGVFRGGAEAQVLSGGQQDAIPGELPRQQVFPRQESTTDGNNGLQLNDNALQPYAVRKDTDQPDQSGISAHGDERKGGKIQTGHDASTPDTASDATGGSGGGPGRTLEGSADGDDDKFRRIVDRFEQSPNPAADILEDFLGITYVEKPKKIVYNSRNRFIHTRVDFKEAIRYITQFKYQMEGTYNNRYNAVFTSEGNNLFSDLHENAHAFMNQMNSKVSKVYQAYNDARKERNTSLDIEQFVTYMCFDEGFAMWAQYAAACDNYKNVDEKARQQYLAALVQYFNPHIAEISEDPKAKAPFYFLPVVPEDIILLTEAKDLFGQSLSKRNGVRKNKLSIAAQNKLSIDQYRIGGSFVSIAISELQLQGMDMSTAVRRVIQNPPSTFEELLHPETYVREKL